MAGVGTPAVPVVAVIDTFSLLCNYVEIRGWVITLHAAHAGRTVTGHDDPARLSRVAVWASPADRRAGVAIAGVNLGPNDTLDGAALVLARNISERLRGRT